MLDIGRIVIDGLGPMFELFKDETVAPTIALGIIVLFVACTMLFLLGRVLPLSRTLSRMIKAVRQAGDIHGFAQSFERVDQTLRQARPFDHAWGEFRKALIPPDLNEPRPVVRNVARPGAYLNLQELGLHFRTFHALPNVFVGLGLLFTFVGLVAALHFAAQGVGGGDLDRTQAALTDLLHAATFKFYTSIAGLLSSIALGFVVRWGVGHLERHLDAFCAALEERLVLETAEGLAFQSYREARAQTEQLKVFNTDFAMTVGRQLEVALEKVLPQQLSQAAETVGGHLANLPTHLQAAVEPVVERLDRVALDLAKQSSAGIGDLAREFHANLQEVAGDQLRSLAATVYKLVDTLEGTSGRIGSSGDQLAGNVQAASAELAATAASIGEAVKELSARVRDDAAAGASARQEQLDGLRAAVTEMSTRVAGLMDEAERRVRASADAAAGAMTERLAQAAAALERGASMVGTAIGQATGELARSGQEAGTLVREKGAEVGRELAAAGQAAAEAGERRLREATQGIADELRGASSEMNASVRALVEELRGTSRAVKTVEASLSAHCQALATATDRAKATATALDANAAGLAKASVPLLQVGQTIATSSANLASSNTAAVAALKSVQEQTGVLADELAGTLEELRNAWGKHAGRFDHVDEELGKAFDKMLEGAKANAQTIRDFVHDIDVKLAESVGRVGGAVEGLADFTDEIRSIAEDLAQAHRQAA